MEKFILIILSSFSLTLSFGQFKPKGTFFGVVPMKSYIDPAKPLYKWYHLSKLTFKVDSVYLEQSPIAIYKKDTIFSTSDGGFYYYAGTIKTYKGQTFADLTLISCDYCPNQFIKFIPPKLVRDTTQISINDTAVTIVEPPMIENTSIKYKAMFLEKTKSSNTLLLDRIIYTRQKRK
jgi:hypothetical protein